MKPDKTTFGIKVVGERIFSEVRHEDIDLLEIYDDYPIAVMIQIEDLGFCKKGEGGKFVDAHDLTYKGDFPVNTGGGELSEALDAFRPTGRVLELACGPGTWTGQLVRHATDVTAVDASAEMLGIASARVGKQRVRFVLADLFGWRPDRRYDVVFFGFWLSHVPPERFASFWSLLFIRTESAACA